MKSGGADGDQLEGRVTRVESRVGRLEAFQGWLMGAGAMITLALTIFADKVKHLLIP